MLSDSYFVAPHDKMMKLMLEKGFRVYAYVLNYTLESYPKQEYYKRSYDWDGKSHPFRFLSVLFLSYDF